MSAGSPAATRTRATRVPGRRLLVRWTGWTTAGEVAGFAAPAVAGVLTAGSRPWVAVLAVVAAGSVEGAALGWSQGHVLAGVLPVRPAPMAAATSAAAVLAYAVVMVPTNLTDLGALPVAAAVPLALVCGTVLLLSIGVAQWLVLRVALTSCRSWVATTAGAWLAGLAAFLLVASPLWHPGQSAVYGVAVGLLAALVMAVTVAVLTGVALLRLLRRNGIRPD